MKFIVKLFDLPSQTQIKTEVLSGITVAMALIPEAVAFSLIAGLPPLTGLYAAIVMGLVTSLIGGRPGMISGATGAIAILLVFALVSLFGLDTKTIGDLASIRGSIPPFRLPNLTFSLETLQIILPYAGMVAAFNEKFIPEEDPDTIVLDFAESRVTDMSAIEALSRLTERYHKLGKIAQQCVGYY